MCSAVGSTSSAGTSHGPSGQNVGAVFPFDHWPPDSARCQVRSETSLPTRYPATWLSASASSTSHAAVPITTPSSASQSSDSARSGRRISSYAPTIVFGCLKKRIGCSGGRLPDSAACAA